MAIAALILWVLTATAGTYLLITGNAARRRAADPVPAGGTPAGPAAVPVTSGGGPPPIPRTKVHSPPGQHPLREFSHPALAAIGLACWFLFVGLHYRPLAWISFGILMLTVAAGLSWLVSHAQAARQRGSDLQAAATFRLIMLHGLAAAVTVVLALLTALSASRG